MCGEKHNRSYQQGLERGSPPHVRGKGSGGNGPLFDGGITPACAGKRFDQRRQFVESEDHPRMCGEKGGVLRRAPQRPGSPPHVRGKVGLRLIAAQDDGITPACAGKSEPPGSGLGASGDHPRMCGEKTKPQRVAPPKLGSPPHVRGKGDSEVISQCTHGITPACAGKRLKRFRSTVPPVAIVPLFPSVCNKPVVSDGSPAGRDAPLFLPAENAVPASPAYNLRSL